MTSRGSFHLGRIPLTFGRMSVADALVTGNFTSISFRGKTMLYWYQTEIKKESMKTL
jgi:hypothetical protein